MKELRRRQEEDEQRRRDEISRHSAGADKTDGEKSEAGSIRSGGKVDNFADICIVDLHAVVSFMQWAIITMRNLV